MWLAPIEILVNRPFKAPIFRFFYAHRRWRSLREMEVQVVYEYRTSFTGYSSRILPAGTVVKLPNHYSHSWRGTGVILVPVDYEGLSLILVEEERRSEPKYAGYGICEAKSRLGDPQYWERIR